jgi:phage-related protein
MQVMPTTEVDAFIEACDKRIRAKISKRFLMLEMFGHLLRMPYSRYVLPGVFELRTTGKDNVRLVYTFINNEAVIFHAFMKKTETISAHEMSIVKQKFKDLHL